MKSDWQILTLGEVIELKRGYDLPKQQRLPGSIPVVSSSGISDYVSRSMVQGPGVVTGRYGTLGQVFYIPGEFWPLNTTLYVSDFKGNDPRYVSYLLQTIDYLAYSDKAAVPGVNRNHLHQALVASPPLNDQQAIAHILGALDDKIALNRRMNATLESIARAIFKSWFVDFDPVRSKFTRKDSKPEANHLFPDSLELSSVGQIPTGWHVRSILDIASLLSGGTPKTQIADYWDGEIPWVSAKDVSSAKSLYLIETEKKITKAGLENSSTRMLPANTTIVTARGTVGAYAILAREMAMNQTNYGLKAKPGIGDYFVLFSIAQLVNYLKQQAYGAIFDTITTRTFRDTFIVVPPEELLAAFDYIVSPLFSRVLINTKQSCTLASIRDTLLPRLISGKLPIPDAERMLEKTL